MKKTIVSLLIGSFLFSACQKEPFIEIAAKAACLPQSDDPSSRNYTCGELVAFNYSGNHCGFLPLSSKNYWVYQDSFFNNGIFQKVQYDTLRFKSTYRSATDNLIWWESNLDIGLPSRLYANESGIYQLERRMFSECTWDANKEFISPDGDSAKYLAHFEDIAAQGRSVKLQETIKTPAGNFKDCILFEKNSRFYRKDQVFFKPGLGVVKYISEIAPMGQPIMKVRQISTLIRVNLD